jgi:hypothetical protein
MFEDLTDNLGYGFAKRRAGNMTTLSGETTFRLALPRDALKTRSWRGCRDSFREMLESIVANGHSFDECKEVLKKSTTDD